MEICGKLQKLDLGLQTIYGIPQTTNWLSTGSASLFNGIALLYNYGVTHFISEDSFPANAFPLWQSSGRHCKLLMWWFWLLFDRYSETFVIDLLTLRAEPCPDKSNSPICYIMIACTQIYFALWEEELRYMSTKKWHQHLEANSLWPLI